ncbi:hypothetical protein [Thermogemmatispora carboxidivorans]|uniref:hypothetical protein n=1 Tax=Thermogemmatispora carboxidivorans TaxID=1382306 RepID=UPI00069AEC15|nr:hypothetical protein [Thermogemmatispora carboxidivorans]
MATSEEQLKALIKDLYDLSRYLHGRGERSLKLARQFEEHAQSDPSNREFDLTQARMLDYQHHIWHEIGNLVDRLLRQYDRPGSA